MVTESEKFAWWLREVKNTRQQREHESGASRWKLCEHCGSVFPSFAHRCRRRTCDGYSALWATDHRMRLFRNLELYEGEAVTMIAVTGPGADYLPWDEQHCARLGAHRHSGRLGCRVQREFSVTWNKHASHNWSELHRAVGQKLAYHDRRPLLVAKAWEYQKRGVLHVHLVFGFTSRVEKESVRMYLQEVVDRAPNYGFGWPDRDIYAGEAKGAAAYLSSYFVGGKGKLDIRETVKREDVPRNLIYVAQPLLRQSGISMRTLRLKRFLWHNVDREWLSLILDEGLMTIESCYAAWEMGLWMPEFLREVVAGNVDVCSVDGVGVGC